jgi:hypothetical protein
MSRKGLLLIAIAALLIQVRAQRLDSVQVALALKDGKSTYRMGEAIVLDLSFTANEAGHAINTTTTEPASPVDEIAIAPADGVFPWLEDSSRGHPYSPDYAAIESLSPGTPLHILLPLNSVYRIDKPGHYSVHVKTHRQQEGNATDTTSTATTNEVSFDVEAMSDADEQAIVEKLVSEVHALAEKLVPIMIAVGTQNTRDLKQDWKQDFRQDWKHANDLVNELNWLSGDPSTRAKVDLYIHPDVFGPFSAQVTPGLWIARNRRLAVTLLEQVMRDSSPQVSNIPDLTARMKATLARQLPDQREQVQQQVELEHLREIAKTLPERTGENLMETATTLFMQLVRGKQTDTPEFATVRELVITHFGNVSAWHIDVLMNAYGKYLSDPRLVPSLEAFLREHQPPIFGGARGAAFNQLLILAPPEDVGHSSLMQPAIQSRACVSMC